MDATTTTIKGKATPGGPDIAITSTKTATNTLPTTAPHPPPTKSISPFVGLTMTFAGQKTDGTNLIQIGYYRFKTGDAAPVLVHTDEETELIGATANTSPSSITNLLSVGPAFVVIHFRNLPEGLTDPDQASHAWFTTESFEVKDEHCGCLNGGICDYKEECLCKASWSGPLCDVEPCSQCVNNQPNQCITATGFPSLSDGGSTDVGKCVCETEWAGDTCTVPSTCAAASASLCKNNGMLVELGADDTCDTSKPCQCPGRWSDATCSTCSIKSCQNGGRLTSTACSCLCAVGFLGDTCQCQGVDISLSINGHNNILLKYASAAVADRSDALVQQYHIVLAQVFAVIHDSLAVASASITSIKIDTAAPQAPATRGSTSIKFRVSYGCTAFNPTLTKAKVESNFRTTLVPTLPTNKTIRDLFNLGDATLVVDGDIQPTPDMGSEPTDPGSGPGSEEGENSAPSVGFVASFLLTLFSALYIY
jgi:hypothetical protein